MYNILEIKIFDSFEKMSSENIKFHTLISTKYIPHIMNKFVYYNLNYKLINNNCISLIESNKELLKFENDMINYPHSILFKIFYENISKEDDLFKFIKFVKQNLEELLFFNVDVNLIFSINI